MIRCTPRGICSWDFDLAGEGHDASAVFDWFTETGTITADGNHYDVVKHGWLSGHWSLEHAGATVASAQKVNPFMRVFEMTVGSETLDLRAGSPFVRTFELAAGDQRLATISPDHAFTRRSSIELLPDATDFPVVVFAFWLTVQMWRRQAKSSNSGGAP